MKIRRGIAALLACVATSAIILVATPLPAARAQPACPSGLLHDGLCTNIPIPLINVGSRKCFAPTPEDHYMGDGRPIQQRICNSNSNEQYYIFQPLGYVLFNEGPPWYCPGCIHLGASGYFIKNKRTNLCVDVRDGAKTDWSVVQQWSCRDKNARSMVWYSVPGDFYRVGITGRSFKLKNFNSELCLDVRSGSSGEFAQLQQYHCTSNNPAQNFYQSDVP